MKRSLFILLTHLFFLEAKELFTPEKISDYLIESNPYISTIKNREKVAKEKIGFYQGAFDTTLSAKYDDKEYPASTGEYSEFFVKKKIENGLELSTGYRRAEGTQELNNIKTGKSGEMLLGVKIPVIAMIKGVNSHKRDLDIAKIDGIKYEYNSENGLRLLNFEIFRSYYTLIYRKAILNFEKELLEKAQERQSFVENRVKVGSLPELSNIEVEQQIIGREQRLFVATTDYENSFTDFLRYLNISKNEFNSRYRLTDILDVSIEDFKFKDALETAKENRPDLKMLEFDKDKLLIDRKTADLLKYPKLNLSLYGVHDLKYGNGFKVSIGMDFPVERSRYESKIGQFRENLENIDQTKRKKLIEIEASIRNIIESLKILKLNIENADREIKLVKRLEDAENRKYRVGSSNLFLLNQREIYSLNTQKKILQYKLNYILLKEQLKAQMGVI